MGFAEGLITGLDAGDRMAYNAEALKTKRLQNEDLAAGVELNKQARSRSEQIRQAGVEAYKSPPSWLTEESPAQPAADGTPPAPGMPTADNRPPETRFLHGLDAMHRKALEVGDFDTAEKLFADGEKYRMLSVNKAMDNADRSVLQNGGSDFSPYIKVADQFMPKVPGAPRITAITPNEDGTVNVVRSAGDGKQQAVPMTREQLRSFIDRLRDPALYRAARIANEQYAFKKNADAEAKGTEESLKAQAEARFKGIKIGPGEKIAFPDAKGAITPERTISNDKVLNPHGYKSHVSLDGLIVTTNEDSGEVKVTTADGVSPEKATAGWPRGTKLTDIERGSKEASSHILDIQKNPVTGFDPSSQDVLYKITARASEIYLESKGATDPRRAAEQAVDEGKRDKLLNPKGEGKGGGKPRIPMPGAAAAPKNDGGVNGVRLFYGATN